MNFHASSRLFLAAAVLGALAVFVVGFFVALTVRSVVADPDGPVPNPGHEWSEIEGHGVYPGSWGLGPTDSWLALELRVNGSRALRLEPGVTGPEYCDPVFPSTFSGTVTVDGEPAPDGTTISAIASDGLTWSTTTTSGGSYAMDVPETNPVTAPCFPGGTISFQCDGVSAAETGEATGGLQYLDLTCGPLGLALNPGRQALGAPVSNERALSQESVLGAPNVIGGYSGNSVTDGVGAATIGGGGAADDGYGSTLTNRVTDDAGTVGGGGNNLAGNANPDPSDVAYATVGGGVSNEARGHSATIGGGFENSANGENASVAGGDHNTAGNNASVGGGANNTASENYSTVGGGYSNEASGNAATVGGGLDNEASGQHATVSGGWANAASGWCATIPGGESNEAPGDYSFAAGFEAKANHQGALVWADASGFAFLSTADNQFSARATGGARFVTGIDGSGNPDAGVKLDPDDNAWEMLSDRNAKENFVVLDLQDVLNRLAGIPITEWNYKTQDPSNRHIGPMAQDFYAAFGLSADDLYISPIDTDGVALAAIQGLYELSQEQDARIQALEARLAAVEGQAGASGGPAGPLSSSLTAGGLLLAALVVGGLVLVQRRRAGGRR